MTITLAMLTYNEAHVLPRLLKSVEPHVDNVVVVDDSEDGSLNLVRESFGPERTFASTMHAPYLEKRTELMRRARGRGDYLLLLDSDHELVVNGPLPDLDAPAYTLVERYGNLRHRMPRLVRGDREWRYKGGPIHEYLDAPNARPFDAWEIIHHGDSRLATEKCPINLAGLLEQLATNPDDARSQFYLGNAHMDLGQWEQAIEAYDRRLRMGGWDEELYCAQLYKGRCQLRLGLWYEGRLTLHSAYLRRPQRAEALMEICRSLNFPDDLLFVETDCYPNAWPR